MTIHIHQGGTVNTYCGAPLAAGIRSVGWESAHRSTCPDCDAAFEWSEAPAPFPRPLTDRWASLALDLL